MTNEFDEMLANQRSYSEMLAEAKKIHPDMQVRLDSIYEDKWEMFMPTEFREKFELSDRFKGTAAWDMQESFEGGYGNELERYRHKQGFSHVPLEGLAEYINLSHEAHLRFNEVMNEMLQVRNLKPIEDIDLDSMEESARQAYWKEYSELRSIAQTQVNAEFDSREAALKDEYRI